MALKFLSKKKWHVRRLENIRKVAEAEAKLEEEKTRMAELRREREEEREFENIRKIQEASGRIPKQQPKLEFLYKTPPVRKQAEEEIITSEDILKGRRPDSILNNKLNRKMVELGLPGSKWIRNLDPGKSDSNLKLREDPITGIIAKRKKMKQEQEERESMLRKYQEAHKIQNSPNTTTRFNNFEYSSPSNLPANNEPAQKPPPKAEKPKQDNNNEIDEESLRIVAQMEEFERRNRGRYSEDSESSRSKKHHHHHHHHRHHRNDYDSDYD